LFEAHPFRFFEYLSSRYRDEFRLAAEVNFVAH
jgi:hypothetical protein